MSYPTDDGLACIKIVEAIAYVHRHLMADAQSLFEQAAKEANIEPSFMWWPYSALF